MSVSVWLCDCVSEFWNHWDADASKKQKQQQKQQQQQQQKQRQKLQQPQNNNNNKTFLGCASIEINLVWNGLSKTPTKRDFDSQIP